MHTVQNVTGRLVEVRVATPLTLEEVQQFVGEHQAAIGRIPGRYVGVVDLLHADVFPADAAQRLIQLLSVMAERVERSAFLIGESALFSLQIERVIRNAASSNRKAFRDPAELSRWLGEILTPAEQSRLDQFLDHRGEKIG
ncbi:MAG TPA: hypothetical protein VKM72_35315 [Thermoanaerobaculia bacterium]|nr:hypothetical protein [Thermoanaerobaculia bacterium]